MTATVAVCGVALAVFGFLWFRPDRLLVDATVEDALPSPAPSAASNAGGATEPRSLSIGSFRNLEHETKGRARILALADGRQLLRLEEFRTSNGPDLLVILSDTPATEDEWGAYDDGRFVSIGPLKGNVGNQNYAIPAGVDVSAYKSVVIWCRRFNVAFGAAPLELKG